ncbi:WD40 repeat-like protein, partial [Aureobasidium melanogenum]
MARHMNPKKFLAEFVYEVEKDFDVDGTPASWAAPTDNGKPAHRFWDDEDEKVELDFFGSQNTGDISSFATSHDGKLVAGSNGSVVGVLNIETKEQCMQFKGLVFPCVKLMFSPATNECGGYTLVIETSDRDERKSVVFFLGLEQDGRMIQQPDTINVDELLQKSLEPVVAQMNGSFELSQTSPLIESVRQGYSKALENLRAGLESRHLVRVAGRPSGFGSTPFSKDGRLFLYVVQNESTQSGPRPRADLPKVIVYDVADKCQKYVLGGHEDAIMWTAFSPDGQYIATAAWDGTFRIFDVSTGDCRHVIGPTGGQCWSGAWSPDSKYVVLCGMANQDSQSETFVAVYSAETAQQVNRFRNDELKHWVRCVAWSPRGEIAIVHEKNNVWIWEPFGNRTISSFKVKVEDWMMERYAAVSQVQWVHEGEMLVARAGDSTIEIWNRVKNIKWRLQRPEGSGKERGIGIFSECKMCSMQIDWMLDVAVMKETGWLSINAKAEKNSGVLNKQVQSTGKLDFVPFDPKETAAMTTNAPSGPATVPHRQLPPSATLVPIDLKVEQERQILYDQRIICGWNSDKIPKWAAAIEAGTRSFFWICLAPDAERDIPTFTRDDKTHMPVGHVSLDKVDITEPDAVPDTTLADPEKGVLTITSLFVLPAFHRSGLGAFAMDECERLARIPPFGAENITALTVNTLSPRYCEGGVEGPDGLGQWEKEAGEQRPVPKNNMLWYEKKGYKRYKEEAPRYTSLGKQGETLWWYACFMRKELQ